MMEPGKDTPLRQALEEINREGRARFYMPGHKGHLPWPLTEAAPYDITEIQGADSLFECDGPLRQLEDRMALCYGAGASLLSAGGSTLCIQAMLFLARRRGRTIIAARTLHRSAVAMMGLLGLDPVWVSCPAASREEEGIVGICLPPSPQSVEAALREHRDAAAVYITSPDYFGQMADIAAVAEICHRYGTLLLVDNAHGAHLNLFRAAMHPMQLGADLCADSLHKNLPALTGAAALHMADPDMREEALYAMSLFGSSSPSYLIMLSADMALEQMEGGGVEGMTRLAQWVHEQKGRAARRGYQIVRTFLCDPIRLTVGFASMGCTARQFGEWIRLRGVEPEYIGETVGVFMPSPSNSDEELRRLELALEEMPLRRPSLVYPPEPYVLPRQFLSISEAMARPHVVLPLEQCQGRVAAKLVSFCPPGMPLLVPGEEITAQAINTLKTCGIRQVSVVK